MTVQVDYDKALPRGQSPGATASAAQTGYGDLISVKALGIPMDGSDQHAAVQAAIDLGAGLYIPNGSLGIGSSTVSLPDRCRIVAQSPDAKIVYTGAGAAIKVDAKKHLVLDGVHVDISGAGNAAIGIHLCGVWFATLRGCKVTQGPAGSTGLLIETSGTGTDFGAYIIRVEDIDLKDGAGAYGIKTGQKAGDAVQVTHLVLSGGWVDSKTTGMYLRYVTQWEWLGLTVENCIGNAADIDYCGEGIIEPGELTGNGGGITYGAHNGYLLECRPISTSSASTETSFKPNLHNANRSRWKGSNAEPLDYYVELSAAYSYGKVLSLVAKGGWNEQEVLSYGVGQGGVGLLMPTFADDAAAAAGGVAVGVLYKTAAGHVRVRVN